MTGTQTPSATAQEQTLQTIDQLISRLERAEGQMKGLRFAVVGLAVLACVALFKQLHKPTTIAEKNIVAETFSVRNAKGDIVAQMGADSDGYPGIAFRDANKNIRLMASVNASGPSVSLFDPQRVSRAMLSLNEESEPSLSMSNADKLTRGVFAIDKGGSGHLVLYGTAGGLDLAANNGRVRWTPSGGAPVDALPVTK